MKRDKLYLHENISGVPYLLPFGQKMADHFCAIELNESSSFIIELLEKYDDIELVKEKFFEKYEVSPEDRQAATDDILCVLSSLNMAGAVNNVQKTVHAGVSGDSYFYNIGGIGISITGPEKLICEKFEAFACKKDEVYQKIVLMACMPEEHLNGLILVRTEEVIITQCDERYILLFPLYNNIYEMHISKDGRDVVVYYNDTHGENNPECNLKELIFNVLRFAYLVAAENNNMYVVHSASVLYQDKAWLFAGKSGEGKTTQTELWNKYMDTPVLNGDLNMIGFEGDKPVVYGIPWCGTSGIYSSSECSLGGIIFIKQSGLSYAVEPEEDEKRILLLQRIISPMWDDRQLEDAITFSDKMVSKINIFRLYCEKNEKTVKIMAGIIDKLQG